MTFAADDKFISTTDSNRLIELSVSQSIADAKVDVIFRLKTCLTLAMDIFWRQYDAKRARDRTVMFSQGRPSKNEKDISKATKVKDFDIAHIKSVYEL